MGTDIGEADFRALAGQSLMLGGGSTQEILTRIATEINKHLEPETPIKEEVKEEKKKVERKPRPPKVWKPTTIKEA